MNDDDDGLLWITITLSIQYIHVQYYCRPYPILLHIQQKKIHCIITYPVF